LPTVASPVIEEKKKNEGHGHHFHPDDDENGNDVSNLPLFERRRLEMKKSN